MKGKHGVRRSIYIPSSTHSRQRQNVQISKLDIVPMFSAV
jgi:hypothetical protein